MVKKFDITMKIERELAVDAAHLAGRAAVLHVLMNGLLATQSLRESEVIAFFKTMRSALKELVDNTGHIQDLLQEVGIQQPERSRIVDAYQDAIVLQLRLIETELPDSITPTH